MFKINDKEVNNIIEKNINVINFKKNEEHGYGLSLCVKFIINDKNGYFTLEFGFDKNNNIDNFIDKEYNGNWFMDNKDILLEIFTGEKYFDSEIESLINIKLYKYKNKLMIKLYLDDPLLKLDFNDEVFLKNSINLQ